MGPLAWALGPQDPGSVGTLPELPSCVCASGTQHSVHPCSGDLASLGLFSTLLLSSQQADPRATFVFANRILD